jgi:hypothetical protein
MKSRKIGIFTVRRDLLDNRSAEIVEMFHTLQLLVVRAEMQYAMDAIEYTAIGPCFKDVDDNCIIPYYNITALSVPGSSGPYQYKVEER